MYTLMAEQKTLAGDIPLGNWIDRLPGTLRPYLRLMRVDRPIGIWVLLAPCWWSLTLAGESWPDLRLMLLFAIGAIVMRGAGCVINDIADRDFDAQVERTAARPIPSGQVSVKKAALFLGFLLLVGLGVLLQLNTYAAIVGACSLLLVFPYPLMKRITYWPQAWLGLTFNWGALVGWAAVTGSLGWHTLLLYAAGVFWTLGYDTIYAHADKEDDIMAGVKSSALKLGDKTRPALVAFYGLTLALIGTAGYLSGLSWAFYAVLALAGLHLVWQITTVDLDEGAECLAKFRSNRDFGLLVFAAILVGKLI